MSHGEHVFEGEAHGVLQGNLRPGDHVAGLVAGADVGLAAADAVEGHGEVQLLSQGPEGVVLRVVPGLALGGTGDDDGHGAELLDDATGLGDQALDVVLVGHNADILEPGGRGVGEGAGPVVVGAGAGPDQALVSALSEGAHGQGEVVDQDLLVPAVAVHVGDAALGGEAGGVGLAELGGQEVVRLAHGGAVGASALDGAPGSGALGKELAGEEPLALAGVPSPCVPRASQRPAVVVLGLHELAPEVVGLRDVRVCVDDPVVVVHPILLIPR